MRAQLPAPGVYLRRLRLRLGVLARVRVAVVVGAMCVAVIMAVVVRIPGHDPHSTRKQLGRPFMVLGSSDALIRHFDNAPAGMD